MHWNDIPVVSIDWKEGHCKREHFVIELESRQDWKKHNY